MPELPEVERVRLGLAATVVGARVRGVRLLRRDVVATSADPPGGFSRASRVRARAAPRPVPRRDLLLGDRIVDVRRRGKQLAIVGASGRVLGVHLGMTGQLLVPARPGARDPDPHVHIAWTLETDRGATRRLLFRDPRRFGGVWTFASEEDLQARRWALLGPDALTARAPVLCSALAGRRRTVKAALLDQGLLAGLGNIYADESLFAARVAPGRLADEVSGDECTRLAGAIRRILRRAIEAGGSSLRDFVDVDGAPGSYRAQHRVYGRGGLPCRRCGRPLASGTIAQRTTVWCERCQR